MKMTEHKHQLTIFWLIAILLLPLGGLQAQKTNYKKQLKDLSDYYEQSREDFEVPGLAVAIVKNGEIIFSEGFGVTDVSVNIPVDGESMFAIASNTKAMTSAALAILVDEGRISWSDKVVDYLPYFRLYDPWVTHNITIKDLLVHNSGLATFSGDLLWYGTNYSRVEVIQRARHLKPAFEFRDGFGYQNIMYMAAGEIIPAVTGKSWDEFVTEKIFQPLGMSRTITSTSRLNEFENVAMPHNDHDDSVIAIEYLQWDNMAPAGAVISSVNDVSKWLILQLNRGIWQGDTIFSPDRSREMWEQGNIQSVSSFYETNFPSTTFRSYGLGWGLSNYLGRKIIGHSGGYDGMISYTCLVPQENLAFVILTNKNSSLYFPLVYKTLDVFLGGEEKDWSRWMLNRILQREKNQQTQKAELEKARVENTKTSLNLSEYTGRYSCKMYGDALVEQSGGQLKVQLLPTPIFKASLKHWHFDTFRLTFDGVPSLPSGFCSFVLSPDGKVSEMKIDVPNPDFDFTELEFFKVHE
jgi:CubicO group peptidase (beta-lactamase class C family)